MEREALEGSSRQGPSLAGDSLCRQERDQSGMEPDVLQRAGSVHRMSGYWGFSEEVAFKLK